MIILTIFAFIAGLVTILSPCILPILPIVLSGGLTNDKSRPYGIVLGFILSFTFFTLFLSTIVKMTGVSADLLRMISVVIIFGFGMTLIIPSFQILIEKLFSKLSGTVPKSNNKTGFWGGLILGLSIGLIWTPCVGPILASIITLAVSSMVTSSSILITFAYSLGTAIPMLLIIYGGRSLLQKNRWLVKNTGKIQKLFGILMILVAIGIFYNIDRSFQSYILEVFPQYGTNLTKVEDNKIVQDQLSKLRSADEKNLADSLGNNIYPNAPELITGGQWFNSQPLKLSNLRGKVVLIDFWTYTCINCIRTLPYIKNWHEKYKNKGLVIIGVHTPEFEFEKNPENVKNAIDDFELKYPIMQDNDYATWQAYSNRYWPAKYFIDAKGKIRSTHFGEGEYDESERLIQDLLKEADLLTEEMPINNTSYTIESRTPETYLGYGRIANFASKEPIKNDQLYVYTAPKNLNKNNFAYTGEWNVGEERALPFKNALLTFNFESKNAFLVMGSKNKLPGKINVYLDNKFITKLEVNDYRLYEIIKLENPGRHILKLEFIDSNLELYAFTFG